MPTSRDWGGCLKWSVIIMVIGGVGLMLTTPPPFNNPLYVLFAILASIGALGTLVSFCGWLAANMWGH